MRILETVHTEAVIRSLEKPKPAAKVAAGTSSSPTRRSPPKTPALVEVSMADVKTEIPQWLWRNRVPLGALTVVDGDPGRGKTTAICGLAAMVTRGLPMPGEKRASLPPSDVVIMSLEDSLGATLKPRMEAAEADPARVTFLPHVVDYSSSGERFERPPSIPGDLPLLEEVIRRKGAKLTLIDPFMAALDPKVDSHKDQEVRVALAKVRDVAERTGCAIVFIRHMSKMSGATALYRGGGSIAIIGAARCGLLVANDPEDPEGRIIASTKNNLGPQPKAMRFQLQQPPGFEVAAVTWGDECDLTADDLVSPDAHRNAEKSAASREFLAEALADGAVPVTDLKDLAREQGLAWRTVERMRARLGFLSRRGGQRGYVWYAPGKPELAPIAQRGQAGEA